MITLDVWAQIRHRYATEKISKRELAKQLGVSRGTVDRALEADRPPKYERKPAGSSFDAYAPRVRALLAVTPMMPASVLAERVGWTGSASLFRDKVRGLRPEYMPADPVDRLVHEPGQAMQCDLWFPHEPLPLGHGQEGKPPVLVMTSAFSGYIQARMLPTRTTFDLLGGMWSLLQEAGAVPKQLVWDNESGIGQGRLTEPAAAFAGVLGCEIRQLPPRDPESKGMVERMNRYFRQGFMPGRTFASPLDFNDQLADWLPRANARYSRTRHGRPAELFVRDRDAMRPLTPVAPDFAFRSSVRLPRDYYVRVFSNDYSVDPGAIGRIVNVEADLEKVTVSADSRLLASHERRWARHQIFTDPGHVDKAASLRRIHRSLKAGRSTVVEERDLSIYDELFGVAIPDDARELSGAGR
ncbi:IS21 family transposase [Arthrobacter nitrophenolicus]|uniref:IS21 family transposase n=1 Tax=Arthrobacter nitrophenolicus TaxID=683150 RepID=A0A4R5XL83_9MICC|nr:IS21 family transposase [Arthrobacter nitrophenolicus]TDL31555.1 IS21 family transposase [Arthrobacter nitrophenolicus]